MIPAHFPMSSYSELLRWMGEACLASSVFGSLFLLTASLLILRIKGRQGNRSQGSAAVTILKPLHGYEPRLFGRLSCLCMQNYSGPVQLVFGAVQSTDRGLDVLERLQAAFPEKSIARQIVAQEHGPNRKVSNLINMMQLAQHDILVMADSDIEVDRQYLAEVVEQLQSPDVGAVTCLYHGIPGAGLWSRLSAIGINSQFLPQVLMALSFGLATPCFGATIAMRRGMLKSIGGLSAFADCLAEDYAIGEAVRASGYRVAIAPQSVGHVCFEEDLKTLLARQMRFARTIKSIDAAGYVGSIFTHPLPFALLGALFGNPWCPLLAGMAIGSRLVVCLAVEKAFNLPWQHYWLIPVQDIISFLVQVVGFFGATVDWRGHRYRLLPDGRLASIEE